MVWVRRHVLLTLAAIIVFLVATIAMWPQARRAFAQIFIPTGCYTVSSTPNGATYTPTSNGTPACPTPTATPTVAPTTTPTPVPTATPTPSPTPTPTATPTPTPTPTPSPTAPPTALALAATSSVVTPGPAFSMTPIVAATPPVGQLALACAAVDTGSTLATPAGWNLLISASQSAQIALYVFWKWTTSTEPTSVTFVANNSDYISAAVRYYRGVNPTTPFSGVVMAAPGAGAISPTTITGQPFVTGTMPVSCFVANTAAGVTAHTVGATEDYSAYVSTRNGNGFSPPYNGTEGQTGPIAAATGSPLPYTASATWNVSNSNGPVPINALVFLAPIGANAPILAGTIADLNSNGFNSAGPNFGVYGNTPIITTGATLTGPSPAPGIYFRAFGALTAPTIVATAVDFSLTPFPGVPTPAPTSTPNPAGTPFATNGVALPANFQPYSGSVVWSSPVPVAPTYDSNSAAVIAAWFPHTGSGFPIRNQEPGRYDSTHPLYFAHTGDPSITFSCGGTGSNCTTFAGYAWQTPWLIPAQARSAESRSYTTTDGFGGAGDSHFSVVQPVSPTYVGGVEYDTYCFNGSSSAVYCSQPNSTNLAVNWSTGLSLSVGVADSCGSFYTGTGQLPRSSTGNTTAGGACEGAGLLNPNQLAAGHINHALFLITNCANGNVFPAQIGSATDACPGTGPSLGARLWLDVTDAVIDATSAPAWEKAIYKAFHDYGGYIMDDVSGAANDGFAIQPESMEPVYRFGNPDPWAQLATQGWTSATIAHADVPAPYNVRWFSGDSDVNGNWANSYFPFNSGHWHVLAPCVTQQTC